MNNLLNVSVKDPKKTSFEGQALAVTSKNQKGKFDVLPYHSNFITIIKEVLTIHLEGEKEITMPVETGIMKVEEDSVKILIGIDTGE